MQLTSSSNRNAKHLKEIAMDLKLLIVEDDITLQQQLKLFFSRFFGSIETANNGVEGWAKYKAKSYDLVITDLTMPKMDGIELSKKIRSASETQNILVMSAHSQSSKLIELINIRVDGFLLKPLNLDNVLKQLIKTCQLIYDSKILEYFNTMLEGDNKDLRENNLNLECALDALRQDWMSERANINNHHRESSQTPPLNDDRELSEGEKMMLYTRSDKMSASSFHTNYPFELDKRNEELEMLEDSFNLLLINSEKVMDYSTLKTLTKIVREYAREIEMIPQFGAIAYGIKELATTFESVHEVEKLHAIMPMITSLFDNLENWRRSIFFYRNAEDIHYLDNSLISDALSLQGFLSNEHASSDTEMELF
jgi:YesN/AraC family two-component response regulator